MSSSHVEKWPELAEFRNACLVGDYEAMKVIAVKGYHWYENENPDDLPMKTLATVYQAQQYAGRNQLQKLRALIEREPWVVNYPWTAQRWLPITQAAYSHGSRELIQCLLDHGADPTLSVGSPDDEATVPEMARSGKHEDLAQWLDGIIAARRRGG